MKKIFTLAITAMMSMMSLTALSQTPSKYSIRPLP